MTGERTIAGTGASGGRTTAPVHVYGRDLTAHDEEPIGVLIADRLTPFHTPLILSAEAVAVEEGSIGCHAATVCREFQKPCVVNLPDVVRTAESWESATVDGDEGTVTGFEAER